MARGKHPTSPKQIEADERQAKALELRKAGVSLSDIAAELGYASPSGVSEAIKAVLEKTRAEPAAEYREIMTARLDEMLATIWPVALSGDMDAMMTVLRIEERRARLMGLDRPGPPLSVKLPRLEKAGDALAVVGALVEKAAGGELLPDEAGKLAGLAGSFVKMAETVDLEARVAALEGASREKGGV
jgi:hypothetical protein